MAYKHDYKKAQEFSAKAWDKIKEYDLCPLPQIFELWYAYFTEELPDLSHAIDLLINAKDPITSEKCNDLYNKFLDNEENAAQVRQAGSKIQTTIKDVNTLVNDVKDVTAKYTGTLSEANEKLSDDNLEPEEVKQLLGDVVDNTKTIIEKNSLLEEELNRQAETMISLQRDLDRVRREALTDGLTGVSNRKAFDSAIHQLIRETLKQEDQTFSLILADIDHFKAFNDNYGHQVGDQVLRLVAKTLLDGVKGKDIVARYGGEEFAVLLPGTNQHACMQVANHLREAVASKEIINRNTNTKLGRITLSGGVTEFYPGDTEEDMIERADAALYTAKNKGRNQIQTAKVEIARAKAEQ